MPATQDTKPNPELNQNNASKDKKVDPKKKKNDKEKQEEELSEEDLQKKEELELLVERLQDPEQGIAKIALTTLITEIKTATTSMTSVPKPLKFLSPHFEKLKTVFTSYPAGENKALLADVLSVLSMTLGKPGTRESLHYKQQGSLNEIGSWGHEYIRNLSGEVAEEFQQRQDEEKPVDDLILLVDQIIPFDMQHNAEHEACDLLVEVQLLDKILPYVDEHNYSRVALYLCSCAQYEPEPEDRIILKVALESYRKVQKWPDALRVALRMNDSELAKEIFDSCTDATTKKQLGFMLGRHHVYLDAEDSYTELINNTRLSEHFLALGTDLEIMEAKTPEDVYKSSLNENRGFATNVDSAKQNLASTFVNAFVNAGFGQDKLMTEEGSGNKWIYKNKEHGMMSAAASLGMILLWDVDGGLTQIDKFLYFQEDYIKAGALLAVGIVNSGVKNDCDPALALLSEYLENPSANIKVGAILGLGLAYNGTARTDICDLLLPIIEDGSASMEILGLTGMSLGFIFAGTANPDITAAICGTLMEKDEASLNASHARLLCLGLGLLYLGKQELAEVTIETLKALTHPIGKYAALTVETCAYAGTGNVLKVQQMLKICTDHLETGNMHQAVAVLGIALIAMGEEIGTEMSFRAFDHLLQYGEPVIRRAVPLALGLLSISNPRITVMDTLSKLSHDSDEEVSFGAILGLGLIGAGTNNSRVAGMLRNLAQYFAKEPNHLFLVRIAQGLVFMGKGTMTLAPYHSDRFLLSHIAISGILAVLHSCTDIKNTILGKSHYLLYCLVGAMSPRLLMTFDENLKPLPVSVRVGQAVDTVGQAGRPKTITGFQTHTTPVLLGYGERAELATDEYVPVTSVLEGFVILKPNPNAPVLTEDEKKKREKDREAEKLVKFRKDSAMYNY